MTTVKIYQPSKTAMQSGKKKMKRWYVDFETEDPLIAESLMGWVSSSDMTQELHLSFSSLSEALAFVSAKGFSYTICNPHQMIGLPKSYAINFTCPRIRGY